MLPLSFFSPHLLHLCLCLALYANPTLLTNSKIKNKVLKLELFSLLLEIEQAQGQDRTEDIADKQKKLANNIKIDEDAAGDASQSVDFQGDSAP